MKKPIKVALLTSLLISSTGTVFAEDNLNDLKKQVEGNKGQKENLQKKLGVVQSQKLTTQQKIDIITKEIQQTTYQITIMNNEIAKTDGSILKKENEISLNEKELAHKKEIIEKNLVVLYGNGEVTLLEVLFESKGIKEFIDRVSILHTLVEENNNMLQKVKTESETLKKQKEELLQLKQTQEINKQKVVGLKEQQVTKQTQLNTLHAELAKQETEIKKDIQEEEQQIAIIENQIATVIQQRLEAERKKREEERKRRLEEERKRKELEEQNKQQNNNGSTPNGGANNNGQSDGNTSDPYEDEKSDGKIQPPLRSGTYRISSGYGYRTDPFTGETKYHNGIDYAAPLNTGIYAAADGEVLYSGKASGYGHWIVILHDSGLITIYGHMYEGSLYVGVGERVKQGQHIAAVGNDGRSSGPHCHFSLATDMVGGKFIYDNPNKYY